MTKRPDSGSRPSGSGGGSRQSEILVRSSTGRRHPFLRGMVTHELLQKGLSFDEAYAVARAVRDRLSGRREVTTAELQSLLDEELRSRLGPERLSRLKKRRRAASQLDIVSGDASRAPFSRGVLARSIQAAGLDLDRAYALVTLLEGELRSESLSRLHRDDLAVRVGNLLEQHEGTESAMQYRLVRSIQRLPRPMVLFLGGASGTGKSTLALDLSPLLRIYRITATDTIRQVMRMVFSPTILPTLHRSSFEPLGAGEQPFLGGASGSAPEIPRGTSAIASFEEQATKVCVGVRAVVERALAENMSIVVEGVHLVPPLVPFPDLEGAAYQVFLMLSTQDAEIHRARFLARGAIGARRSARYLESFSAIREIQDFLLQQAEHHDVPLLNTTERESTLNGSLRLLTGILAKRYPRLAQTARASALQVPTLLLAIDGLPDRPLRSLGGRTPLEAARTPTLDRLAREGRCGLADPVAPGVVPDTASGSLALLGQSPQAMKRGPVEAMGAGLLLSLDDVALRGNFATLDDRGWVSDRRAGRIREGARELAAALDHLQLPGDLAEQVTVRVGVSTEHRLAVVLQGEGLSSAIAGSDPGDGAPAGPPLVPRPLDPGDEAAARTAQILALFEQQAQRILSEHPVNQQRQTESLPPVNAVLTRGPGRIHRLPPLEQAGVALQVSCIGGDRTLLGLASWMGARAITDERMTANLDTDLKAKFELLPATLETNDLVVLHLKGADIAAHDRRIDQKVAFIEAVDQALGEFLASRSAPLRIAVASDHATLSEVGRHAADPVPVLIWGEGVEADEVTSFGESAAAAGALHRFPLQLLLPRLFEQA